MGFLVSADILIVPSKKYVRLEYYPCKTREEVVRVFKEQTLRTEGNEFVEGLMYNEHEAVIMTGSQTDDAEPGKVYNDGIFPTGYTIVKAGKICHGVIVKFCGICYSHYQKKKKLFKSYT